MADIPAALLAAMRDLPVNQLEEMVAAAVAARKEELEEGRAGVLAAIARDAMLARFDETYFHDRLTFYTPTWQPLYGIDADLAHAIWAAIFAVDIPKTESPPPYRSLSQAPS